MTGGRASRQKGNRAEIEAVRILQDAGLAAEKQPLSGALGGRFSGDISCPVLGIDKTLEVKARASGFRQVYAWLASNYGLVIRADREQPLIVIRLTDFATLAIAADKKRNERNLAALQWLGQEIDADQLRSETFAPYEHKE